MAQTPGGSFIPKRSTGKVAPVRAGKRIYIFSYIAYVFFFGTMLSVAGIFFLNQQAEGQLQNRIARVVEERDRFNEQQIELVRNLDTRIKTAESIFRLHAAPSVIFDKLERTIINTVQLKNFSYERETGGPATISFGGFTSDFDVLLFQREMMDGSFLDTAILSEVSYGAANSEESGDDNTNAQLIATVSFAFEHDEILESIGYYWRGAGAGSTAAPSTASSDGDDNVVEVSDESDDVNQVEDSENEDGATFDEEGASDDATGSLVDDGVEIISE